MLLGMIDLMWNFPLLREQEAVWREHLERALREAAGAGVEMQRPSFRTVETELRERAARWLGFTEERTWVTAGGHHGTLNALLASGVAGTKVAMEAVSYPGFIDQCRMTKTGMVACAVDDEGMVPASLEEVCARAKAEGAPVRGVFTMPTVQNPLGFVTPQERRVEIAEIARAFGLVIIEDDAYGYMEEAPPPSYAEIAPERTFYVRGLSKSFAPALRTGFLVAPGEATEAMVTSLKCTATGTDVPQNLAALALCEDGVLERVMAAKRVEGAWRNHAAREVLGAACAHGARSAWHLWVRLPEGTEPNDVAEEMLRRGVMVSSGTSSTINAEDGFGLRVALGGEVERERMMEGVRVVAEVLKGGDGEQRGR